MRTGAACWALVAVFCGAILPLHRAGASSPADAPEPQAQQVLGNWLTQDRDGIIQISLAADGSYQGRIVGGGDPGRIDVHNPDPAKRNQPLLGQVIMQGMRYLGTGHWSTGTIRDPGNGHVYKCRLELLSADRLQVRGFFGVSLLGRSQVWTRYLGTSMRLPPAH